MIDKRDDEFLATNIKGMMMTLIARWNARMDAERAETEFAGIRPSDMRVFGNLRGRTIPLSDVHREMGFSRQAAQQAVARLVNHGMILVEPAPDALRDKMMVITEKGQRRRALAARQIREVETDCADAIGAHGMNELRELLIKLVRDAECTTKTEP